jgi:FkbM family methyltransferase
MSLPTTVTEVLKQADIIFDIGANRGRTVAEAHSSFPEAKIYAFEPVSATYILLVDSVRGVKNIETFKLGFSDKPGLADMRAVPGGLYNKILTADNLRPEQIERVTITTGDDFCSEKQIAKIDFLKIDTEGNDLKVLAGFEGMISRRQIRFIQVETGISQDNKLHVNLIDLMQFFFKHSYGLVNLYDPVRRNPPKKMMQYGMYFCNSLFAAEEMTQREKNLILREERLALRQKRLEAR